MSTRGRIGIVCDDGKITSIYNHSDSYPSYLGDMLLKNYTDRNKVEKLIALGDCSIVKEEVDIPEGKEHSFDNRLEGITVAYGRDRGETNTEPRIDENEKEFWKSDIEEYGYLFKDNKWYVATSHGKIDENDNYIPIEPCNRKVIELTDEVIEKDDDILT